MLNRLIISLLFLLTSCSLSGQIKRDYTWISGALDDHGVNLTFLIDFRKPLNKRFSFHNDIIDNYTTHNNSSVSNTYGELQFFTNGCDILGKSLNSLAELYDKDKFTCGNGYPLLGGSLILPRPGPDSIFYYFNLRMRQNAGEIYVAYFKQTRLESNLNGTQSFLSDNELILQDSFGNAISAVQHGNGRDWWVFVQKLGGDFYRGLLTPEGFSLIQKQTIGPFYQPFEFGIYMYEGQMCFSPNGKHLATYYEPYGLCIYDFDRCTGLLDNPRRYYLDTSSINRAGGVAFSEDSRFLYCFSWRVAFQLDMQSSDLENSITVLDTFDGFESPMFLKTTFWQPRLTPEGQIYVGTTNGTDYWHLVEYPNKPGKDCNFIQHAIKLPTYSGSPPNVPYYRAGAFIDSPCDTLTIKPPPETCDLSYFPNPADNILNIEVCGEGAEYEVYDVVGRRIYSGDILTAPQILHITTKSWASGTYLLRERKSKKTTKLLVQH